MSQLVVSKLFLPTGSNWNEHSPPWATIVTGADACAAASASLLEASAANDELGDYLFFVFKFSLPLYNSTQNTAGVPQERTPLQIVCAPAPVRIRRPSSIKRRPESLESEHRSSKSL